MLTGRAAAGLLLLGMIVLLVFAGPPASPWDWDRTDLTAFGEGPSARHWLGTTQSGRDVFALTLHAARRSLLIGLLVAVLSTGLAAVVGTLAGFLGGRLDRALMGGVDLMLVLPPFLVVAVLSPFLDANGRGWALVPLLAAFLWMATARSVRAMTVSLRDREFVMAARFLGVPARRVVLRHVVPHLASLLAVDVSVTVGTAIIAESGLSYLGFGVRPPDASLGTLLADAGSGAIASPVPFGFAASLLVLIVFAVSLLGDGLRDVLDPEFGPEAARP
ncbi:ABC transporter permease [Spirillospora albida]|uniref:ABC transporter permease n=1 Tax=Spirillospora albida TaxID=58123 RepID=UPI00056807D7|nr:ABC transporter permease [Spirillospora albida]